MAISTVFMGTSEFSVEILQTLSVNYEVKGVVTQPDKPAGRGKMLTPPPVKVLAEKLGFEVYQPEKLRTPESYELLRSLKPELIVVSAYGQILRQNVLDLPQYGCINVHGSFLPRWRGASPIQSAILHGDRESGVTIMKMDSGVDTGPELLKLKTEIESGETYYSLSKKLAQIGASLLITALDQYLSGKITPKPQDEVGVTYATMIKKEDGILDFSLPAVQLERKIRAYLDWPGCSMSWNDQWLKIRQARVEERVNTPPGFRTVRNEYPAVGTIDGELVLLQVQPAGKNRMDGRDFLRGAREWSS